MLSKLYWAEEERAGEKVNRHESPSEICWAISWRWGWELLLLTQFIAFSEQMEGNLSVNEDESHKWGSVTTLLERITCSFQKSGNACYNYGNDSVAASGYGNWINCGHCNNGSWVSECVCLYVRGVSGYDNKMFIKSVNLLMFILKIVLSNPFDLVIKTVLVISVWNQQRQLPLWDLLFHEELWFDDLMINRLSQDVISCWCPGKLSPTTFCLVFRE